MLVPGLVGELNRVRGDVPGRGVLAQIEVELAQRGHRVAAEVTIARTS
jgi:hypothetical protein